MQTEMLMDVCNSNPALKKTWEDLTPMNRLGNADE